MCYLLSLIVLCLYIVSLIIEQIIFYNYDVVGISYEYLLIDDELISMHFLNVEGSDYVHEIGPT